MNPHLGKLVDETAQRDAIHIAIAPVVAGEALEPGQHVGLLAGRASAAAKEKIGIVDPFLTEQVWEGQCFYLCLYQQTVTNLRHNWSHPAFDKEAQDAKAASEQWLREYAARVCPYDSDPESGIPNASADFAFRGFMDRVRQGEIFYHGKDLHGTYELEQANELMHHLSVYLGRPVGLGDFTYSCSC